MIDESSPTVNPASTFNLASAIFYEIIGFWQGFVKGEVFCFRYLDFYFRHGGSTSTDSQLTSTAAKKVKF